MQRPYGSGCAIPLRTACWRQLQVWALRYFYKVQLRWRFWCPTLWPRAVKGGVATAVGLAILLGADVGSAIVTQLLMVRQPILIPLLLLSGVVIFMRDSANTRQIGRILIGLALIFVLLDMIRAATRPLVANPRTRITMAYLGRNLVKAFVLGAGFAWVVH